MGIKSRKLYVWLISLGAVLAIYLLYNRMSKTPEIDFNSGAEFTDTVPESNVGKFDSEVGRVGKVGVGTVQMAEYEHRDEKTKKIDRVFGFEKLLYERGDEWEIEKPYMNIFRRNFKCYITADKGKVQVKTTAGRPAPKDATLTGNVVIRILPKASSDIKEGFVYLDDVDFISERSLFTTAGPVKFVNEEALMLGRGLELVYNEGSERLEFLRIIHVESLSLKSSSKAAFSSEETDAAGPAEPPGEPVAANVPKKAKLTPATGKEVVERKEGEYYGCVFSKNVFIDAPEQLVFTDELSINNIFWPKSSSEESEKTETVGADNTKAVSASVTNAAEPDKADTVSADSAMTRSVTVTKESEPNKLPEEAKDIVLTCDNGCVVVPMDSKKAMIDSGILGPSGATVTRVQRPQEMAEANGRNILVAQRIDYCSSTGDAAAEGPLELTFYPNDVTGAEANEPIVPVKITAQKKADFLARLNQAIFEGDCLCTMPQADSSAQQDYTLSAPRMTVNLPKDESKKSSGSVDIFAAGPAELTFYVNVNDLSGAGTKGTTLPAKVIAQKEAKFLSASNKAVFEGDTLCTMLREYPNSRQEYKLSAPRLTVSLPEDKDKQAPALAAGIEHLRADGGVVRLSSIKTARESSHSAEEVQDGNQGKVLSGTELKCTQFDYDNAEQLFLATGPGVIKFYNSKITKSEAGSNSSGLDKPCWAFVEDFDTLKYLLEPNLIIVDARPQGTLLINHFPIVEGQVHYDQQAATTAGHIEALLYETADGERELSTLHATDGITYEDKDKRFVGSELFYDCNRAIITVQGDEVQPCLLNGAFVDAIEYDLKTGKVKAEITGPGALQRKR